jgi:hypothetical protein
LIHDCLRDSSRARSKWQETHYSDGKTYLEGLVETVANNHDVFSGNYVQHR